MNLFDSETIRHVSTILQNFCISAGVPFLIFFVIVGSFQWRLLLKQGVKPFADCMKLGILLFGVAILGACAGFAGGMSRTSAVGDVIPAMFTLLGGVAVYLFGVDMTKGVIATITASCLAVSLFLAYSISSQLRYSGDEYREIRARCMDVYTDPEFLKDSEAQKVFNETLQFGPFCKSVLRWSLPS